MLVKRLKHRCFPVVFTKFLKIYERLLLKPVVSPGVSFLISTLWLKLVHGFFIIIYSFACQFFLHYWYYWYCNQKQSSGGVLQRRCCYEFCKIHKKTPVLTCVFNQTADLQSLTLSKKEVPTQMFSCKFCEISHNTIFKWPKKLSISAKKRHCTVDVRPGSKYASLSSHEKV